MPWNLQTKLSHLGEYLLLMQTVVGMRIDPVCAFLVLYLMQACACGSEGFEIVFKDRAVHGSQPSGSLSVGAAIDKGFENGRSSDAHAHSSWVDNSRNIPEAEQQFGGLWDAGEL